MRFFFLFIAMVLSASIVSANEYSYRTGRSPYTAYQNPPLIVYPGYNQGCYQGYYQGRLNSFQWGPQGFNYSSPFIQFYSAPAPVQPQHPRYYNNPSYRNPNYGFHNNRR